tara:strand:- start:577 stop:4413 length:3837 start_codon:yes stop_codon:yes gene_type:complete
MSLVSLVIKSKDTPPPKEFTWESIQNITNFTKNIQTQSAGADGDLSKLSSVISGMPTVFARANMFRVAMESISDPDQSSEGLIAFYGSLLSEWKGLITCIALNPEKISVRRVELAYKDGNDMSTAKNIYEIPGSLGNVLFERKPLWSDLTVDDPKPFIDVILYTNSNGKKIVIGGTSPDSLFFTSASYNMDGEKASYVNKNGKFKNPVETKSFDPPSIKKLHSYVNHLKANFSNFTKHYTDKNLGGIGISDGYHGDLVGCLDNWLIELNDLIKEKNIPFDTPEVPQINLFSPPFSIVANHTTRITALDGIVYEDGEVQGGIAFDPSELLLPKETKIACVDDDGRKGFLSGKPILLLKAEVIGEPNEIRHFLLPLTPKGIKVFGNNLSTVLGIDDGKNVGTRLNASYNPDNGLLKVNLKVHSINNKPIGEVDVEYKTTSDDIFGKDILIWPNFVSPKWEKYFLYSEMPHNSPEWKALPFSMDMDNNNQMICEEGNQDEPLYLAKNGNESKGAKLHIDYSTQKTSGNKYEYEIFESKNPFKGFKILNENNVAGYAVVDYGKDIKIKSDIGDLQEAHLGVDFGSTNSAIAFRRGENGNAEGYKFENRRVSLFNPEGDEKNNDFKPAVEDEVFFFQNDEINSNEIKSVLSIHDKNRLKDDKGQNDLVALSNDYVKGGFPCFEKNLPIEDSTNKTYKLKFQSIGESTLIHNMKWDSQSSGQKLERSHRAAYLKSLMLHCYADLFDKGLYPKTLKWAYPSAMGQNLIGDYNPIWQDLTEVNPLISGHDLDVKKANVNFEVNSEDSWGGESKSPSSDSGGWGSSDSASSGWGSNDSASSGWGNEPSKSDVPKANDSSANWDDKKPKIKSQNSNLKYNSEGIEFDFSLVDSEISMTESCAVASYLASSTKINTQDDALTICFDIGGSTTDIIVLGQMVGPDGKKLSMIKQSSIRFAAQRISQATKFSPNFNKVLVDFLNKKNIKVEGINNGGANKFNENTAPYYFEQLVDRLEGEEFDQFYQALASDCKEMFSVNLYVTGLIIYYAGQLAKKVKLEIDKSPNKPIGWRNPKIQLQFTGKGSRIMDWFKAYNQNMSDKYYMDMFVKGFGGMEEAKQHLGGPPVFQPRNSDDLLDIKYEVAKGLASDTTNTELYYTKDKPVEVIGEEGFIIYVDNEEKKLSSEDSITVDYLQSLGGGFTFRPENPSNPCPKFTEFAQFYFQVATEFFGLKATKDDFMNGIQNMNIVDFIKLMPEYKEAKKNTKGFDFVAPIIIIEGMKFLDNVLLKKL